MKNESIFFAFGPARGGTTYLGNILDKWFDVGTGPEGTFIPKAVRFAGKLGDLSKLQNKRSFAEYLSRVEMLEIIRKRYPEDLQFDVTPADILDRMQGETVSDGVFAVFKSVADYRKKKRVGNKNPGYWKYLPLLLELFPQTAYFIFIVRDGRDVALSLRNVPWGGQSIYEAAIEWKQMVQKVEQFKKDIPEDRLLILRYEDILQKPGAEIERLGYFLGQDNLDSIKMRFQSAAQENKKKSNFDKWKTQLSTKEVEIFEAIAGKELSLYGYSTVCPNPTISILEVTKFKIQRLIRLLKLNLYSLGRRLPQDKKKWKPSKIKRLFRPGAEEK